MTQGIRHDGDDDPTGLYEKSISCRERGTGHEGDGDPLGAMMVTAGHDGDGDPPGLYDAGYPAMMATVTPWAP